LQRSANITDDEIEQMDGNRENMVGKIQEKYGIAKYEAAERHVDEWTRSHRGSGLSGPPHRNASPPP
jgi:hypothetical protein